MNNLGDSVHHEDARRLSPARRAFTSFTTRWFLIPQGTGILAIVLNQLPYQFHGLHTISIVFWFLNMVLLAAMLAIFLLRLLASPRVVARSIATDTTEAACTASISIAFMSCIQMLSLVVIPSWGGRGWSLAVYILWWVNCALAVLACIGLPDVFVRSIRSEGGLARSFTPVVQLPLIAALTSAAGAGTLCQSAVLSTAQKVPMIVVAYLEIGLALPTVLAFDVLYLARLLQPWEEPAGSHHEFPPEQMYSHMVLCGPWGQSSFALQTLGKAVFQLKGGFGASGQGALLFSNQGADTVAFASILVGLVNWGQGTFWWAFAIVSITRAVVARLKQNHSIAFHLSLWATVFPWQVVYEAMIEFVDKSCKVPNAAKAKWTAEAKKWRLPYWHFARLAIHCRILIPTRKL
ncbi:hypothetical protein H634G_02467 [Metarhizium anisopliae BRIP 53293]|uniref:Malic acid transport protein n=1 Tax=Metarhizium anisopliae BRIP 53293 TaxID=1291518 RepID=A0A0D9P804_METAN|nr:hypothetical protein H634G_02467 [Metarhizium anisopliae BRIP 53293]KJK88649.1 hypothetical protein H633G_07501 [Metarhizium anisopliae BRIP 53284]